MHNAIWLSLLALACAARKPNYQLDASWQPQFPVGGHTFSGVGTFHSAFSTSSSNGLVFVTQRGNASVAPVIVLDATTGEFYDSWGQKDVALDRTGSHPTWGAHGIAIETCNWPNCGGDAPSKRTKGVRVYVEDFTKHTVTAFSGTGKPLFVLGTPGVAGNSTNPIQFGNVADAAIEPAPFVPMPAPPPGVPVPPLPSSYVYASDGDGGTANRVVKIAVPATGSKASQNAVQWATPAIYDNPHSIALHRGSGLLVLADREHNVTRLLDSDTGTDLGVWDCGLDFGAQGTPFGVRTLAYRGLDMVIVASMDNPQDRKYQLIHVLDGSKLTQVAGSQSECTVLQTITIDPRKYSGPHLLGVDTSNGDIYAALVSDAPKSTVLRFRMT